MTRFEEFTAPSIERGTHLLGYRLDGDGWGVWVEDGDGDGWEFHEQACTHGENR